MTAGVVLRPVRHADLDTLALWRSDPWFFGEFEDFGFRSPVRLANKWQKDGLLGDGEGLLLVTLDDGTPEDGGTPIGEVQWRALDWGPPPASRSAGIRIALLPEYRGMGYGTEAQRVLVDYLFAASPVNRVEATTDVGNLAEQRCLEKIGLTREGTLRGAQFRAGAWHDLALYSRLRGDRA